MNIEVQRLKSLIEAAYDKGYWGGAEAKEQYLTGVLAELGVTKDDTPDEEFRLWNVSELRELEEGTSFEHSKFGPCKIAEKKGEKFMIFASPLMYLAGFNCDGHPWDLPMRRITNS